MHVQIPLFNVNYSQLTSVLIAFYDEDSKSKSATTNHVMISYQWDVQDIMIQVKDRLQAAGFRVWMDLEQMGGSTLEAMAKAVEDSAVVLLCVSQKYKESSNCRSG
jgi:male-specific lethal 1